MKEDINCNGKKNDGVNISISRNNVPSAYKIYDQS